MGLFDKICFFKPEEQLENKCEIKNENPYIDFNEPLTPEPEEPKEEWIWVEGYKGVNENMQGYGGYQYELGVEYSVDGEIKECRNGLHFSKNLKDTFSYKDCLSHRFFKVKGLVKASDVALYGQRIHSGSSYGFPTYYKKDKLVAKKIILTEEITYSEEMLSQIQKEHSEIQTFDDVKKVRSHGYDEFVKMKYREMFSKYFSELFVELFIEKFYSSDLPRKAKEIITYMEEGVSKDVAIYLLMK